LSHLKRRCSGGRLLVRRLDTGAIFSDGGIAAGTADRISGGVFVIARAFVDRVRNLGSARSRRPSSCAFDLMLAEVHRYEGTVNQCLGDGIMALFGAAIAR